jgi:hypothetical protein
LRDHLGRYKQTLADHLRGRACSFCCLTATHRRLLQFSKIKAGNTPSDRLNEAAVGLKLRCFKAGYLMHYVIAGLLILLGLALSGCSSPSVPSWAVASTNQHIRPEHLVSHAPSVTRVATRPSTTAVIPDTDNLRDVKAEDANANDATSTISGRNGSNPFKELDRRQEEERRRMKAFITICSNC